jgi:hypothetical protein
VPTLEIKVAVAASLGLIDGIVAEWVAHGKPNELHSIARAHFQAFRKVADADRKRENSNPTDRNQ